MSASDAPQTVACELEPFDSRCVADHAQGVRESLLGGNHRRESAFRQGAVADFTAAGAAHEAGLTHAEGREIVVQHEALGSFTRLQQLDALLVVLGSQCNGDQGLGFAAGEQGRAVSTRQNAGFDGDLADLVHRAAIGTAAADQHFVAEDALFKSVVALAGFGALLVAEGFQ